MLSFQVRRAVSRRATAHRYLNAAATSKQKRALTAQQVSGTGVAVGTTPAPPLVADAKAAGSSFPLVPIGVGLLVAAGSYFYYTTTLDTELKSAIPLVKSNERKTPAMDSSKSLGIADETGTGKDEVITNRSSESNQLEEDTDGFVKVDSVATTDGASSNVDSEHKGSNAVEEETSSVQSPSTLQKEQTETSTASSGKHAESFSEEAVVLVEDTSMTDRAIAALQEETAIAAARALVQTHTSLATSVIDDLEEMNASQLKAKIFQLSAELQDRTKWEAVRLKEFLTMKEKETAEKYLEIVQKQRLELEEMMAKKLREKDQEHASTMLAALQEKEAAIQSVVQAALEAQKQETEADKAAFQDVKATELATKMEEEFGKQVEEYKTRVAQELQEKADELGQLTNKLQVLESALETSQASKQGSLKAHRLSAAALALSEKLETSGPAPDELSTLQQAAGNEGVIATACATIPKAVQTGVPTITMLQARFDKVVKKCRQAMLIPEGELGLEGQLVGMFLASVKSPPNSDDKIDGDDELKLVQAQELVAVGALEEAIDLLEALPGQASLVLQDWKKEALDRVAVEKSLKVIKMECALLNKSCVVDSET